MYVLHTLCLIIMDNICMSPLVIFISIVTLFVIGSIIGWVIELFFRRFISQHRWMNPGFLVGPYLPIYGFGTIALYGLSNIDLSFIGLSDQSVWGIMIKIVLIAVIMVLVEFIAGLIFIKGMKIKLWDYSNRKGNIMGIICPSFSLIWLIVGALYYFFINKYLVNGIYWLSSDQHQIYYFFIGIILGMILVDFAYSIHLATRISKVAKKNKMIINFDELKENLRKKTATFITITKKGKKLKKPGFFFPFKGNKETISQEINEYAQNKNTKNDEKD